MQHLGARGFLLAPRPVVNRSGGSQAAVVESLDGQATTRQFAVFTYLDGEDWYEWFENPVHEAELASAAEVLADPHRASRDFAPGGLRRLQEPVVEYTPAWCWCSTNAPHMPVRAPWTACSSLIWTRSVT